MVGRGEARGGEEKVLSTIGAGMTDAAIGEGDLQRGSSWLEFDR